MASGVIHSITFTPSASGVLIVTVTGQAQGTAGGDWGSAYFLRAYANQGSNVFGEDVRCDTTRRPFALTHQMDVTGGVSVTAGLWGELSGAVSLACWDVKIDAQVIKR